MGARQAGGVRARGRSHDAGLPLQRRRRACPVPPGRRRVHDLAAQPEGPGADLVRREGHLHHRGRRRDDLRLSTRARCADARTIAERVKERPEQSYATRLPGPAPAPCRGLEPRVQERPAAVLAGPQRRHHARRARPSGSSPRPTPRGCQRRRHGAHGRFFFGLEDWIVQGRGTDPAPALRLDPARPQGRHRARADEPGLAARRPGRRAARSPAIATWFASPGSGSATSAPATAPPGSISTIRPPAGVRPTPMAVASPATGRSATGWSRISPREALSLDGDLIRRRLARPPGACAPASSRPWPDGARANGITFDRELAAGEIVRAGAEDPVHEPREPGRARPVARPSFDAARTATGRLLAGRRTSAAPSSTRPVPQLDALHMSHLTYVQISDPAMPGEPALINTSVGTSTYSNCGNESCMINQELDQRGLADDARRRLEVWLKYQGTEPLIGRFSDKEGVLHGAGSFSFAGLVQPEPRLDPLAAGRAFPLHARPCLVRPRQPGDPRRVRLGLPPAPAHDARPAHSREAGSTVSCRPGRSRTSPSIATG